LWTGLVRAEGGERHRVEVQGQVLEIDVAHLEILDLDVVRSHARDGEEAQGGEGFNFPGPARHAGKGHAELEEAAFRDAEAADCDEADFHGGLPVGLGSPGRSYREFRIRSR
jgi:hypothetical protein